VAHKILATLTSKGQNHFAGAAPQSMGSEARRSDRFRPPGGKSVRIEPRRKRSIFERLDELKLPSLGRPLTQKDIENAITEAMTEKVRRSGGA
jgi:hypothetical protein